MAVTLKVTLSPRFLSWLTGWLMIARSITASVATWLVTLPKALVTRQLNRLPESANCTLLVV